MKKLFLWLIAAMATLMMSCTQKPKHLSYIPSNSLGVMAYDVKSMGMKSLTFDDVLKTFKNQDKDSIMTKLKDSGVDFLNTVYLFGSGSNETDMEFGALFIVSDQTKFEKGIEEFSKNDGKKFQTKGDVKYLVTEAVVFAHKGDIGLVIFSKNAAEKRAVEVLDAKPENTLIAANKNFASNASSKADIKIWIDYGKITELVKKINPMASSFGLDDYKDSYLTTDINFEDGKIVGNYKVDGSKALFEKISKLTKPSVNAEIVKNHPGNDLILAYAAGISFSELGKQYTMLKGPVDMTLDRVYKGLTYDYLAETFSGDIVGSINGIRVVQKEKYDYLTDSTYMAPEPTVDFAVSLGVADNKKLNPILDSLAAKGMIIKNGNNYAIMGGIASIFVKEGVLQIVGSKEYADQLALGKTEKISGEALSVLSGNASAITLDLTKVKPEALDAFDKEAKEAFNMVTIEGAVIKNFKPESTSSKGEFVVNFKDKKQNSLKSLGQMFMEIGKKAEEKRKQREEEMQKLMESIQDSTVVDTVSAATGSTELP